MPLYDYCCPQGHLFEQMATIAERERQDCPACGQVSEKIPSRISLAGRADPGPASTRARSSSSTNCPKTVSGKLLRRELRARD